MAGYTSPLEGYYSGGSSKTNGYSSPLDNAYPKKTKQQIADEDAKRKLDQLAQAEKNAPKSKNLVDNVVDFGKGVGGFVNDNIVKPAADFGSKTLNTLAYIPQASAQIMSETNPKLSAADKKKGRDDLASTLNNSFVSSKVATGKATPLEFAGDVAKTGLEASQYVAPVAKLGVFGQALVNGGLAGATDVATQLHDKGNVDLAQTAGHTAGGAVLGAAVPTLGKVVGKIKGSTTASKAVQDASAPIDGSAPKTKAQALKDAKTLDNADQVGQAVKNVATPAGQVAVDAGIGQTRYASKTLKESDFVGIKDDNLGTSYNKTTNAQRADQSLKSLDEHGIDKFSTDTYDKLKNTKTGKIDDQTVFDAQASAQALEEKGGAGNLQKATDIYNELSNHLTKAGQTVQAASIMARRTPQGLRYYAQKQFQKAGVELDSAKQAELDGLIKAVKSAPAKSEEAAIARDNVMYFVGKHIPSSKGDQISNFWRAGLLTAPTTPAGAILGNAAQALQRSLATDPIAVLSDAVMGAFTGKRTTAAASFGSSLKGGIEGAKTLGDKQFLKTGKNKFEVQKEGKYDTPTHGVNYGQSRLGKATGAYVNGVFKVQAAADLPFRAATREKALSSMANAEALNRGLKGAEKKAFVTDFRKNPPAEAAAKASTEAEASVFGNDTELGKVATGVANSFGGLGRVFVPFSKVPSAVATKVVTSTPIGIAHQIVKQVLNVKKGGSFDQRAMAKAIGEGTTAVPILGAGYALAQTGQITGGYPSNQEERDQWQREGKQPNSIRVGDKWYSLNYIQPFGTIMSIGAGIADAEKSGADPSELIASALASGGKSFLGQSFLQGISSGLDAVNNPAQFAGRYAANLASSVVPNFIRSGTRASDPLQRDTSGIQAGLMGAIPGLRDQLPAKLDNNGKPLEAKASFIDQFANPLKPSNVRDDTEAKFYNDAVAPASALKSRRTTEVNDLLSRGKVSAAQRKIDEYNQQLAQVLHPYVQENGNSITQDQLDRIDKLFMGTVSINKTGHPYISSRTDLQN